MQLIEEKTAGQSEVSCYTIKDRDTFVDFCVGPHVPSTGRLKAFKLLSTSNAYWKGDARNQPMQRIYGTAFFSEAELKAHLQRHRGSEEARPPQARQGARPVHVPPVGAGRDVLAAPRARRSTTLLAELHARGALPGRLRRGEGAARLQQGAVGDVRALAALSPEHVPRRDRRRADGHEGDELPGPHAGLRAARCAAIATCRSASTSRRRCTATRRPACCPG